MPHAASHDARIYWRTDGDPALPALVLGNSLGTDFSLWDAVLPRLLRHFYVVRYDMRGHGASDAPDGEYSLDVLTDDLEAVIEAAGLKRLHYLGISLGGMVGMSYASRRPEKLDKLMLSNTNPRSPDRKLWLTRIKSVLDNGMAGLVDSTMARFFTPEFLDVNNTACQRIRNTLLANSPTGYAGCCAAIRDMDLSDRLSQIAAPTLVITGEMDASTPTQVGTAIAAAIADSTLISLRSAHIPCVEIPLAYSDAVIGFLDPADAATDASRFEAGLARRKQVLGNAHVERSMSTATPFTAPFQAFITRYAWGELWSSTRLEDLQRRLLVVAMTAAQGRWEEFEIHVGGALRAGIEPEALQETLLHVAVYCGVPAANTAFKMAAELIREHREGD